MTLPSDKDARIHELEETLSGILGMHSHSVACKVVGDQWKCSYSHAEQMAYMALHKPERMQFAWVGSFPKDDQPLDIQFIAIADLSPELCEIGDLVSGKDGRMWRVTAITSGSYVWLDAVLRGSKSL